MKLAIVVPCYNEESVISETTKQLTAVCEKILEGGKIEEAFILYVDDGSQDATWAMIEEFSAASSVKGLKLAHNAGHQNALWAGLEWAAEHVDVAISIDADLQDDVAVILQMVEHYLAGNEIVYAVRKDRPNDTWFKKHSALFFYKLINNLGGDIVYNHADYRLMSRKALVALMLFPERNLFLRGMVRKLGFRHTRVYYDRRERFAGESKYPLGKMLSFALDGITSFSVRPLRFIVLLGILFMLIAFGAIVWGLFSYADGRALPGWTSLMVSVWFIGGAILTAMGIIGEYVGKIYNEVKRRPRYIIEKFVEK
jgi:glycosyltransferase involved in cell wall biosynthesis